MQSSDFFEISVNVFLKLPDTLPFNVYLDINGSSFVHIMKAYEKLDRERLNSYIKKGVKSFLVPKTDRKSYIESVEALIPRITSKTGITYQETAQVMEELTEQTLLGIYEDGVLDELNVARAESIVKAYIGFLQTDKRVLFKFLELCREETYFVRHAISTSIFAILIAQADGQINERSSQIVGLGGLLHDVGMIDLPHEIEGKDRQLTAEEWQIIQKHPSVGRDIAIQISNIPGEIIQVIEQHHESYDGSGYPYGMKSDWIFYPARVVALADSFSALTTRRGGRALYEPQAAIEVLMADRKKYDPKLLKAFINLLGTKRKNSAA